MGKYIKPASHYLTDRRIGGSDGKPVKKSGSEPGELASGENNNQR